MQIRLAVETHVKNINLGLEDAKLFYYSLVVLALLLPVC
jgi:hypothetical protein